MRRDCVACAANAPPPTTRPDTKTVHEAIGPTLPLGQRDNPANSRGLATARAALTKPARPGKDNP